MNAESLMASADIAGITLAQTSPTPEAGSAPAASANTAPEAQNDCVITAEGAALGIPVLQNDRDADGDPLAILSTTQPESGQVTVDADGSVTFTPDTPGLQSFDYQASDGQGGTATATVTTFVNPADGRLERPVLEGASSQELAQIARSCVAATTLDLVTLEGEQVQVAAPKPGQRVQVETEAGQRIALEGGEFARASYFVVDGGLLVLTEDGRTVFLSDFAETARAEPATTLSVAGGPPVPAEQLLANLQPVEVPTAPQTTVYRYDPPDAGPLHGGGAGFDPYDPGAIGPGLDPLGPLPPTALGPRPEFVLLDPGTLAGAAEGEPISPPPPPAPPPPPPPPPAENARPQLSVTGQVTVEVGEVTDPVDPVSGPPFPQLEEKQSVDLDLVNGVDQRNLTLGPSADATISFRNEFAAFQNTLGVYLIGPDGQITAPRVVFAQVEHADALAGLLEVRPGGGPLNPGDPVRLSELYAPGELAPGTRFGLFTIADGFDLNGDLSDAELRFLDAGGNPATIFDPEARLVAVLPDGTLVPVGGELYHTASPSADPLDNPLNTDGGGQVLSGLEADTSGLTITFEDMPLDRGDNPRTDNDFNDVTFEVLLEPGTRPSIDFVQLNLALDADISDADDTDLGGAAVQIASGFQLGDALALGVPLAGTGITLVEDGSNGSLVLDGDAPISTYVSLLRSLQLDPAGEGVRQLAFTVEDVRGQVSNPVIVRVNLTTAGAGAGDDEDDNLIGQPGANDFIAGRGGNDNLNGFSGNDTLDGGLGNDVLNGGPGDDLLIGGPGSDTLIGGDDADRHLFLSLADRGDRILGFDAGEDTLDFSELLQGATAGTIDDFVTFTPSGTDVAVNVDADGSGGNFGSIPYLSLVNPTGIGTPQEAVDNGTVVV
jgi:Ca2+-binding RTX toxin-like protein